MQEIGPLSPHPGIIFTHCDSLPSPDVPSVSVGIAVTLKLAVLNLRALKGAQNSACTWGQHLWLSWPRFHIGKDLQLQRYMHVMACELCCWHATLIL